MHISFKRDINFWHFLCQKGVPSLPFLVPTWDPILAVAVPGGGILFWHFGGGALTVVVPKEVPFSSVVVPHMGHVP